MNRKNQVDCAVYIRNLVKCYGSGQPILENLDMTVNKGTIYGMLGASGCGKTTVLSCIVGLQPWNTGDILVLGQLPGKQLVTKLGYMPQDLALYDQLSTFEIIQFYGKLYKLSPNKLKERWQFLKALLQIPDGLKLIRNMSGGQRRRASLALALIHNPELLLLDEPTVGLDPLLREKIWEYLRTIVSTQNVTIIITTHYIEEARFCDMIGVIRNGKMIAENSSANLLQISKCELLEEAVTKLCHEDAQTCCKVDNKNSGSECNTPEENSILPASRMTNLLPPSFHKATSYKYEAILGNKRRNANTMEKQSISVCDDLYHSFEKVCGYTKVIALTLIRHPAFLVLLLTMPTVQSCLALATIGARVKNLHFGVVNYEVSDWKNECDLQNSFQNSCDITSISCRFISKIQEDDLLILDSYENDEVALKHVQLGHSWGFISFPANYSTHLLDLATQNHFASNYTLEGSRIHLQLDHSQSVAAFFIVKHLYNSYFNFSIELAKSCGIPKEEFELPLHFRPAVYGDYSDNYVDYMLPGDWLMALLCLIGILSALIFVADYKQGTLSRARVAGLNIMDILMSHIIIQSVISLVQIGIVTGFQYFALDIAIKGTQTQMIYLVISYLTGVSSTAFGLLLGILCREEVSVFVICIFITPIYIFLGGVCFPTETATWFWQQIGYIVPLKLPIMALRSALVRGLGITHILVWPGIAMTVAWIFIFSAACIFAFKTLKL